jgi:hypothetical protein
MKRTGSVESLMWDERGGKLRLSGATSDISIYEVQKPSLPKDLKAGDLIAVETVQRGRFEVLLSLQRQEAVAPQQTPEEIAQIIRNAPSQPIPPDVIALIREADSKPQVGSPPTSITVSEPKLPDSIPELQQFILVTGEALKIYHAKLNAVNKLNVAQAIQQQTLLDAQRVSEALLWAKAKLGELLQQIPLKPVADSSSKGRIGGSEKSLPEGISYKQSHYAQQLAKHPELIRETIDEAIEDEDIPTQTVVMQKIKQLEREKAPPEPPREESIDTGPWTCPICKKDHHLLHHANGKHECEEVEVIGK